jgi:hypothetical protein
LIYHFIIKKKSRRITKDKHSASMRKYDKKPQFWAQREYAMCKFLVSCT